MKISQEILERDQSVPAQQHSQIPAACEDVEKEKERLREQARRELEIKAKEVKNKPLRMLRMPDVIYCTGLARSTIYALMAKNKFPRQVKVSENTAAWVASEIDDYLAERIAMRDSVA